MPNSFSHGRATDQCALLHADGPGGADPQTLATADTILAVNPDVGCLRCTPGWMSFADDSLLVGIEM